MSRVALLSSEPIRPAMGGIGVRYLEMARHLLAAGFDVVLVSPANPEISAAAGFPAERLRRYDPARRQEWLAGCDVVVAQGQLANDVATCDADAALVFDLYDPWLIENLSYAGELGLEPYRNDHRSWVLQLGRGDLFLCASEEQRLFYLGFLVALGRIHPRRLEPDPTLGPLVVVVPFGCTPAAPRARRDDAPPATARRLLFGGIYDWYDIETLIAALERVRTPDWTLTVVRNANPESTPQRQFARFEAASRARGWWSERVRAIDWVDAERRLELIAAHELVLAPHRASLESDLSFRTRYLDALAAGCPVVATRGGALARLVGERRAGWVVEPGAPEALAAAIDEILAGGAEVEATVARGSALASELTWPRVLAPLVDFIRRPRRDSTRRDFASRPQAELPREAGAARLWRRLRRRAGR